MNVYVNQLAKFALEAKSKLAAIEEIQVKNMVSSRLIKYNASEQLMDPSLLPFYDQLYQFQKELLRFGITKNGRVLIADEMGVGKTVQSLALACMYRHEWPLLVICPSSLRLNWRQEVMHWLKDIAADEVQVYKKGGTSIRSHSKVLIISYDLALKMKGQLQDFQVVICDEAHYLKNSGSKRTEFLVPYLSERRRVLLLTGTPAFAKPKELFNLLSIVRPDIFCNFKAFGARYCEPTKNPWSRQI